MFSSRTVAIGGISAILTSIAAYNMLQKTFITSHLEVFVQAHPETVFDFVKDPNNLVEFTHEVKEVEMRSNVTNEDGFEELDYLISHQIPHIGRHKVFAKHLIDQNNLEITYETVHFNGFMQGEFLFKFKKARHKNEDGTLVVEEGKVIMPWLLRDFANKTTITQHSEIMENIKFIVEMRTKDLI